jgi:hypothetical protein
MLSRAKCLIAQGPVTLSYSKIYERAFVDLAILAVCFQVLKSYAKVTMITFDIFIFIFYSISFLEFTREGRCREKDPEEGNPFP